MNATISVICYKSKTRALSKSDITPMQKMNRTHKICHDINQELRTFGKELNITTDVTTYVARHSFATVLKKSGVNIGIISQAFSIYS